MSRILTLPGNRLSFPGSWHRNSSDPSDHMDTGLDPRDRSPVSFRPGFSCLVWCHLETPRATGIHGLHGRCFTTFTAWKNVQHIAKTAVLENSI